MQRVTNVRFLCVPLLVVSLLPATSHAAAPVTTKPSAKSPQAPQPSGQRRSANAKTASAAVNPLRSTSPVKVPSSASSIPTGPLLQKESAPRIEPAPAEMQVFVPNTGRLQIFRAAQKPAVPATPNTSARGTLFPQGAQSLPNPSGKQVMRYEDVARGAALVPIKPRTSSAPMQGAKKSPAPVTAEHDKTNTVSEPEPEVKRLPPLNRTAPRPKLPPGYKLPQEPIRIYPETGQ